MEQNRLGTRRQFLGASAAALGLSAIPAFAKDDDKDPFGGFTVGVQSYCYRNFKIERAVEQIRKLGLRHVEFSRVHVASNSTEKQIAAVRNLCRDNNITAIAYGVEEFTKDHDANRRIFDFARNLGVRYLSANPTTDSFDSLDKLVAGTKIAIAIHPHGPVTIAKKRQLHQWYSAEAIMDAVKKRHRLIGSCLDTGHLIRCAQDPFKRKLDPAAQVRHMGERNFGMHLKDHDNEKRIDVVFGRGVLDVPAVLRALREVKFAGWISIEYEANPDNPTPDIRACLDVLREAVRKLK
jgi:sugar phosphate isomerase/epimerase